VVFGAAILFSLVVVVLGGLIRSLSDIFFLGFFSFAGLGIATAILTLLTIPIMLVLPMFYKGVFTSFVAAEIGWTWILWVMWASVGGSSANISFVACSDYALLVGTRVEATCNEATALSAFGFLTWIILMFYNIALITLTLRLHFRGYPGVWTGDVTDTNFTATKVNNAQFVLEPKVSPPYPTQYPPAGESFSVAPQPTAVSYDQSVASRHPQSEVSGSYSQPQAGPQVQPYDAGSFAAIPPV